MASVLGDLGSAIPWSNIVSQVVYWFGIGLIVLVVMVGFFALFYFLNFNYKVTMFPLYGSGQDGVFSISKAKTNRVKWNKKKTAWLSLFPLFNKQEREPFDSEYIYPGKNLYVFDLNGEWVPGRINITQDEQKIRGEINAVPHFVRNWQSLQHKKNAIEFAADSWWDTNKQYVIMMGTVLFCCILTGATIYFTYRFAGASTGSMDNLASSLKNFGTQSIG